ncbi:tryptophanase leader peptide [Alginatibacterium sediminis]|uniref:Tryptophanase leader peptide n=1 Tax=Alginatibacterium sediminis TaxID=2164068 RepID=A0A420ELI0_9ALTE|nr:tryptophanase leader peptide [Alginatibacterium sediminis]
MTPLNLSLTWYNLDTNIAYFFPSK